jgi:acetoin utilization protein AcuB
MKQIPRIEKYMSTMPHTIGRKIPITVAYQMMREHRIRHLPVQDAGKLVGVLSDRDIKFATSFNRGEELRVEDVMTADPFTAKPDTPVDQVVTEMAEHRYGCTVVQQDNGKVVGIFTTTDGLRVLGELMQVHYRAGVTS